MPLYTDMVGIRGSAATDFIEDRWTMAYAASVYDTNPAYYANIGEAVMPTHPAYVSHLEWDAIGLLHAALGERISLSERLRGVHSYNHTTLQGPFHAGEELSCTASVVGVERRRSGGKLTIKTVTTSASRPIATSYTSTVFRGVDVEGGDDIAPDIPRHPALGLSDLPTRTENIEFTQLSPYHFTECARDYGPVHTDPKIASEAGLPGLIMHGTGTIAYALSSITNHEAGGNPTRITGFEAKLAAMIMCPSTCTLHSYHDAADGHVVRFELLNEDEDKAITDGIVHLTSAP